MSKASTLSRAIKVVQETAFQHVNGYHLTEGDKESYRLALSVLKDLGEEL